MFAVIGIVTVVVIATHVINNALVVNPKLVKLQKRIAELEK